MIKHRLARITISSGSLLLTVALALFVIGAVAAQSQLPGAPLTDDPANDLRPAWSPDSTQIAFFSIRTGNYDIWVMDADGSNERQLTDDPEDDRRPTWSPDSAYIAFDSDRGGSRNIWVIDINGENPRRLVDTPGLDSFASWSPDGTQIAFFTYESGVMDLWVVAIEDFLQGGEAGQPQQLTTTIADENQSQCTFACHVPAWSPDGTQIAYSGSNHTEIWIVGIDGSDPYSLAHDDPQGNRHHHFPTWTQDGKLLFLSEHITDRQEPVNDVWVMDADGSNATLLFPDIPHGGPFYWSPDGSAKIAFHSPRAGNFDIYLVVLGQEELPAVESSAPTEAAVVEEVAGGDETPPEPTDVVAVAPASTAIPTPTTVSEPAAEPGGNLALIWVVAVVVLGGLSVAVYLTRRGRPS